MYLLIIVKQKTNRDKMKIVCNVVEKCIKNTYLYGSQVLEIHKETDGMQKK